MQFFEQHCVLVVHLNPRGRHFGPLAAFASLVGTSAPAATTASPFRNRRREELLVARTLVRSSNLSPLLTASLRPFPCSDIGCCSDIGGRYRGKTGVRQTKGPRPKTSERGLASRQLLVANVRGTAVCKRLVLKQRCPLLYARQVAHNRARANQYRACVEKATRRARFQLFSVGALRSTT